MSTTTPQLPRLRPALHILPLQTGELRLRGAERDYTFEDPPEWVRPFLLALDGRRDLAGIGAALSQAGMQVAAGELDDALVQLSELGLVEDARDDELLSGEERERYDRQLRYFGDSAAVGESGAMHQARLRDARVVVLGLGALGGQAALALAASGVGRMGALDGDVVELSNLNRQTLYSQGDIGRSKADVAAERIAAVNPSVCFTADQRWLTTPADVEAAIRGADLVVDAVDTPAYEIERWVNDACFKLGIPYIAMSHYPPSIRVGPTYIPGETGCYRCQEVAWRADDPAFDAGLEQRHASGIASTSACVGAIVALEVIHHLTGVAQPSSVGAAMLIDLSTLSVQRRPVVQVPGCAVCSPATAPKGALPPQAPRASAPAAGAAGP